MDNLIRENFGPYKFFLREGSSDIKTIKEVILKRSYQRREFPLENGKPWLDLGANIGAFTIAVASQGSKVRAYEPDEDSFELLQKNVELNGLGNLVELHKKAVVESDASEVTFHINSANKNYWRNSTVKSWRGGSTTTVPAVHFSRVIRKEENLKMDVEGSEMSILEAMEIFPERMVFEWSFDMDSSIKRFLKVRKNLLTQYNTVFHSKFDESSEHWKKEWFPPCKTVFCY